MKDFLKRNGLPILLLTTVLSGCAYIYSCGISGVIIGFIAFSFIYSMLVFGFLDFLKKKNNTLLTAALSVVYIVVHFVAAVSAVEVEFNTLFKWFLEPSDFSRVYAGNITALLLFMGSILGSGLFYFTAIRYRAIYVFLIIMCPFALFAKTFTEIPVIYTIILVTLYFVIMITNNSGFGFAKGNGFYVSVGVFIAVVTIVSSFFPKLQYAPYREDFDELITGISIGSAGKANLSDFSETSATSGSDDDEVLFRLYGDNPVRLRRQCFNLYDAEEGVWNYYGNAKTGNNGWKNLLSYENTASLANATGYNNSVIESEIKNFRIIASEEPFYAVYVCRDFFNITPKDSSLTKRDIYRTELDEFFAAEKNKLRSYEVSYYETEYAPDFSEYLTDDIVGQYSSVGIVSSYIEAKQEAQKHNDYLLSSDVRKSCYKSEEGYERVKSLTKELVKGKSSDYEKAKALEDYFRSDLFVYDDKFSSTDSSIENFIFNTRRGTCLKYATAMTLMCREAGLTARYVEGLVADEFNSEKNCYELDASKGHAYVEVWIDGYGWTDFDPTSGNVDNGYMDDTFAVVGIIAAAIALIIVSVLILRPVAAEAAARNRIRKSRGRTQLVLIYRKMVKDLEAYTDKKLKALTSEEIAELALSELSYSIYDFIFDYRSAVYGGCDTGDKDYSSVYYSFKAAIKAAEKARKKYKK